MTPDSPKCAALYIAPGSEAEKSTHRLAHETFVEHFQTFGSRT